MQFQWWKALQFVQMSRHNCLRLTNFTLKRLQCILVHCPTVCKLRNCILRFACYECFQIRQLHIIRKWCGVKGTPKLAYPLMPLQWISIILLQFSPQEDGPFSLLTKVEQGRSPLLSLASVVERSDVESSGK